MAIKKGTKKSDSIVGTASIDTLYGLEGNDTLKGQGGNDKLYGGAGSDKLYGGTGNDKLYGDAGNDTLYGEAGNDSLTGGDGNDILNGDAGNDTLSGGNGNDTLNGGANNDRYSGGAGTDTAVIGAASTAVTITKSGTSFIISSAATGTDTILSDVENVKFTNGTFSLLAKTFDLTNGSDTGAAFTGGLNSDTFNGRIDTQFPIQTTYSGGDVLNGGGGTDQLRLQISGVGANQSAPPISLTSIETVTILNQNQFNILNGDARTTIDASLWNGVTRVVAENGITSATTIIDNLGALVTAELKANSSNLVIDYSGGVLGGLADTQTLVLSQSVDGFFSLAGNVAETLNVISQGGDNFISIDSANSHSTINVTGSQSAELSLNGMGTVLTINAGAMTGGGLFVDDIGASDIAITGSAFDDGFIFGTGNLTVADVINGGGGTDLLGFGQNNTILDTDLTNVTSIETLAVGNDQFLSVQLGAQAQEAGITAIDAYSADASLSIEVIAGFTGALTVNLDAADAGDPLPEETGPVFNSIDATLLTGKLTVTALASSFNGADEISASTSNTTDELKLIADNGIADLSNVTGIDTITVVAGTAAGVGNDITIELLSDSVVESGKTLTVNAAALTNSNANFYFNGENETDGAFNVTGGSGADQIRGGAGNDVIDAGSGDDRIGGGSGTDNLKGGIGNDSFYTATADLTASDTVDGGGGTDVLFFTDSAAVADTLFTRLTSIETVASDGNDLTLTLGSAARTAGVTTVDGTDSDGFGGHNIDITAAFNGPLTVNLGEGDDRVVSASASQLTVGVLAGELGTGDTLTGGSGTTDTLRITADGGSANLLNVTNFETVTILANPALATLGAGVIMADATLAAGKTLAVNAAALTNSSAAFFFDGSAESGATSAFNVTSGAGNDVLTGGAGNDTIAGGNGNDTISGGGGGDSLSGGAGNDVFETQIGNLSAGDTIDGGAHTTEDTLKITGAGTIDDTKFTNVTNVEVLDIADAGGAVVTTLGAEAFNAGNGIKRFVSSALADSLTIAAGYTGAITVDLKSNAGSADTVTATGSAAAVTVEASAADISDDTLVGGTTLNDVLKLTADNGTATLGAGDSGFETITLLAGSTASNDVTINVSADAVIAAAAKLTINASALTNDDAQLFFDASAVTTASKTVDVTGGAGADSITGGAGNDTIAGGAGNDTILGGGGADSLTGGEGNDSITGGTGNDIVNTGNGSDVVVSGQGSDTIDLGAEAGTLDQDTLVFNIPGGISGVATVTNFDAATGATAEDRITVQFADAANGGEIRASGAVPPLNQAKLIILDANATGYFATFDAVTAADALQTGSGIGESYVFVWNDTTGKIHVSYATVDNAGDSAVDSPTDLAILTGVTFANLNLSDFII